MAPLSHGSSRRRPRSRSCSIDDFASGAIVEYASSTSSMIESGTGTPFARATACASRIAALSIAKTSGSAAIGPMEQRVAAVIPLKTDSRTNFDQMSTSMRSLSVERKCAGAQAARKRCSRGDRE